MNRRSVGLGALSFLGVALAFAVEPVAAQSVTNDLIRELNQKLLYVALPITLFVEGILVYTVWRYRDNDDPKPTEENRRLEITWTIATAIILLFVGVAAYQVLGNPFVSLTTQQGVAAGEAGFSGQPTMNLTEPNGANSSTAIRPTEANAVQIEVVAYQWGWEFHYPNGKVSQSALAMPTNRPVYLHITSKDVIHAVHVPTLGLKQDAIPGQYNTIKTKVTEPGKHQLYCAEFCGSGHSAMLAEVDVMSNQKYQQWLNEGQGQGSGGNASSGGNSSGNSSQVVAPHA